MAPYCRFQHVTVSITLKPIPTHSLVDTDISIGWAIINASSGGTSHFNHFNCSQLMPSLGFSRKAGVYPGTDDWKDRSDMLRELLKDCWKADIVTVTAAGNYGKSSDFDLSESFPQNLATATNPLIVVGACDADGNRWEGTTLETSPLVRPLSGLPGEISTWLDGDNVRCASKGGGYEIDSGTSLAAPQISGLIAYYFSLPQAQLVPLQGDTLGPNLHQKGRVAQLAKDYLVYMQFARSNVPRGPVWTDPGAFGVPVASNGASKGYCVAVPSSSMRKRKVQRKSRATTADEYGLTPLVTAGILVSDVDYDSSVSFIDLIGFMGFSDLHQSVPPTDTEAGNMPSKDLTHRQITKPSSSISPRAPRLQALHSELILSKLKSRYSRRFLPFLSQLSVSRI